MIRFAALLVCCLFCPAAAMASNPDSGMGATTPKKVPASPFGQMTGVQRPGVPAHRINVMQAPHLPMFNGNLPISPSDFGIAIPMFSGSLRLIINREQ